MQAEHAFAWASAKDGEANPPSATRSAAILTFFLASVGLSTARMPSRAVRTPSPVPEAPRSGRFPFGPPELRERV
jgi:hypothetical protein